MSFISATVCTYNRCESLRETLDSLSAQRLFDGVSMEIVVVDNNSTDRTAGVVQEAAQGSRWPVRYVREPKQGIGHARNRGLAAAQGDYVAFIDDDALADPDWAAMIARCFEETQADMVGGKITPLWLAERPRWLTSDLMGPIMGLDFGDERKRCRWETFLTTNCALRKSSLPRYGQFDATLGRRGSRWIGGEDLELCERWLARGAQVIYEPAARVQHKVSPQRVSPEFFRRWFEDIGTTQAHQLPWKWHYRLSVLPSWRWAQWLKALARLARARLSADSGYRLRSECWWLFERAFLLERLDHWLRKRDCRFTKA